MTKMPFAITEHISKRFYGTQALNDITITLTSGEIHALIGENGAGKSTFIKILSGVHQPDMGTLTITNEARRFASPRDALVSGIVLIPQELRIVPAQTVAENVLLGHLPTQKIWGFLPTIDRHQMRKQTQELLTRFDLKIDPDRRLDTLSFAERQLVMIARALNHDAQLLILDEPTAALETHEVDQLFEVMKQLKSTGVAIVFVSHRLDEVAKIADVCTILRDGQVVEHEVKGIPSKNEMIRLMTGRELEKSNETDLREMGGTLIEIEHTHNKDNDQQSVSLHQGEIVGLAGLLGGGMTELLNRIYGASKGRTQMKLRGTTVEISSPADAIRHGIGLVPSERSQGLIMELTVRENIILPNLSKFKTLWGLKNQTIDQLVEELMEAVDMRPRDPYKTVRHLSGGNQQKVIFARWLAGHANVLLLNEPTHGIDIGAKAHIHKLMSDFADQRGGIVFTSSEMTEVLSVSNTVLAMKMGEIVAHLSQDTVYNEHTLRNALGG